MAADRVPIQARGPSVPRLCYGTLALSSLQRSIAPHAAADMIVRAADRGVTMLDTAEYYDTYEPIRLALRERPGLFVITKSFAFDDAGAEASVSKAISGIGRGYIDMFLMHEQESEHTVRGHMRALERYRAFKQDGVIGRVGISTHKLAGVRAAIKHGMDAVMAPLNIDGLGLTDGARSDMERALADAHDSGITVIIMKTLGGGHLISSREEAIRYAMSLPFADAIAIGMASRAEIDYNTALFRGETPPESAASESASAPRTLMIEDGCIGCGACAQRCGQRAIEMRVDRAFAAPGKCIRCGYCAKVCPMMCIKIV